MSASLNVLMDQLFDYAGLFPPAALPMEPSVREFSDLQSGPTADWLGRFVCPVHWLGDFGKCLPADLETAWPVTVLGTSLEGFRQDLNAIERFEAEFGSQVAIEAYEVKAKPSEIHSGVLKPMVNSAFEECFIELPFGAESREVFPIIAESDVISVKGRTGGLEANVFPSSEELALWIRECVSLDLPFKFTAGLHHPLPFDDAHLGALHHGFINVWVASVMAFIHDLNIAELQKILTSTDPNDFWFTDKGLGWRDWEANLQEIRSARQLALSIGSCSIAEPEQYLTELNWYKREVVS